MHVPQRIVTVLGQEIVALHGSPNLVPHIWHLLRQRFNCTSALPRESQRNLRLDTLTRGFGTVLPLCAQNLTPEISVTPRTLLKVPMRPAQYEIKTASAQKHPALLHRKSSMSNSANRKKVHDFHFSWSSLPGYRFEVLGGERNRFQQYICRRLSNGNRIGAHRSTAIGARYVSKLDSGRWCDASNSPTHQAVK